MRIGDEVEIIPVDIWNASQNFELKALLKIVSSFVPLK
jgi:hypothetical protein